jgi:hypothetical protein
MPVLTRRRAAAAGVVLAGAGACLAADGIEATRMACMTLAFVAIFARPRARLALYNDCLVLASIGAPVLMHAMKPPGVAVNVHPGGTMWPPPLLWDWWWSPAPWSGWNTPTGPTVHRVIEEARFVAALNHALTVVMLFTILC